MKCPQLLDTIATLRPIPAKRLMLVESEYSSIPNLPAGQVGTVVEVYMTGEPRYLIEFSDLEGREYAMARLTADELLVINYELQVA